MHDWFEWRDDEAAHQYRLMQARRLIRTVKVVYNEQEESLVHVNVSGAHEGCYHPVSKVVKNKDLFDSALYETTQNFQAAENSVLELLDAARKIKKSQTKVRKIREIKEQLGGVSEKLETL